MCGLGLGHGQGERQMLGWTLCCPSRVNEQSQWTSPAAVGASLGEARGAQGCWVGGGSSLWEQEPDPKAARPLCFPSTRQARPGEAGPHSRPSLPSKRSSLITVTAAPRDRQALLSLLLGVRQPELTQGLPGSCLINPSTHPFPDMPVHIQVPIWWMAG